MFSFIYAAKLAVQPCMVYSMWEKKIQDKRFIVGMYGKQTESSCDNAMITLQAQQLM